MRKILIATPAYGGQVTTSTASAVSLAIAEAQRCGWEARWLVSPGSADIADTRNKLLGLFLASTCDDLLFWDADISCGPGNFEHLIKHTVDMVAGLYRTKRDDEEVYPVQWMEERELFVDDGKPLLKAMGVPAGFLRITRKCVETMAKQPDVRWIEETDLKRRGMRYPFLFDWTWIKDGEAWKRESEDYTFSRRWREAGGDVWVDPALKLNHAGQKVFEGDFMGRIKEITAREYCNQMRAGLMGRANAAV